MPSLRPHSLCPLCLWAPAAPWAVFGETGEPQGVNSARPVACRGGVRVRKCPSWGSEPWASVVSTGQFQNMGPPLPAMSLVQSLG